VNGVCAVTNNRAFIDKADLLHRHLFTRENLTVFLLLLILIAIIVATADQTPQWIYQGF
jgi:hypothetical protein